MSVKEVVDSAVANIRSGREITPETVYDLYKAMAGSIIVCFGAIASAKRTFVEFDGKLRRYDPASAKKAPVAAIEFDFVVRIIQQEMAELNELATLPQKVGVRWTGELPTMVRDMPLVATSTMRDLDTIVRVLRNTPSMREYPTAPRFFDLFRSQVIDTFAKDVDHHMAVLARAGVSGEQRAFMRRPVADVLALHL